jgi:hypothetical protein
VKSFTYVGGDESFRLDLWVQVRGFAPIGLRPIGASAPEGIMELWSNGIMGLKVDAKHLEN